MLKDWLKANNLTQEQFEERSGVSQAVISRACNGGGVTEENAQKILAATGGAVDLRPALPASEA